MIVEEIVMGTAEEETETMTAETGMVIAEEIVTGTAEEIRRTLCDAMGPSF